MGEIGAEKEMKRITFIHAADLHLDSPMTGLSYLPKKYLNGLKKVHLLR